MTFTSGIPASGNNPSQDQPLMLGNFTAINNWTVVDHVGFNTSNSGTHDQVTFTSENTPASPTDPVSIAFTAQASTLTTSNPTGSGSTVAQEFYRNQNGIFPTSCIKAFGSFVPSVTPTILMSFNVTSIVFNSPTFDITLVSNSTKGNNAVVLTSVNGASSLPYTFVEGLLRIQMTGPVSSIINFCVIQI